MNTVRQALSTCLIVTPCTVKTFQVTVIQTAVLFQNHEKQQYEVLKFQTSQIR